MVHSVNDILAIAEDQKMPLEQMRFFINRDYKEPKAFGIFQDPETLEWVVYKNKADGTRAERYRGFDNPSYSFDNSDYYKDDDGGDWWNDDNDWVAGMPAIPTGIRTGRKP